MKVIFSDISDSINIEDVNEGHLCVGYLDNEPKAIIYQDTNGYFDWSDCIEGTAERARFSTIGDAIEDLAKAYSDIKIEAY